MPHPIPVRLSQQIARTVSREYPPEELSWNYSPVDTGLPRSGDSPKDVGAYEFGREAWRAGIIRKDYSGNSKSG